VPPRAPNLQLVGMDMRTSKDLSSIKGQHNSPLSSREDLRHDEAASLKKPRGASGRIGAACLVKESIGQLPSYPAKGRERASFDGWQERLQWQRFAPYR
jgi:hypothetical protein